MNPIENRIMGIRAALRRKLARRLRAPDIDVSLQQLARRISPTVIYDVGAYKGEFAQRCLRVWPSAAVVCFEVLGHALESLKQLQASSPSVQIVPKLLGSSEGEVPFTEKETASSVLDEWFAGGDVSVKPVTTIRAVTEQLGRVPEIIKIDTQGYELEVLKGADGCLGGVQAIIAELNLLDLHKGVPLIADVMQWLNERDFVAYDISELHRRPLDDALWQVDLVFVPRSSPLRTDKRWGSS